MYAQDIFRGHKKHLVVLIWDAVHACRAYSKKSEHYMTSQLDVTQKYLDTMLPTISQLQCELISFSTLFLLSFR